MAFALQGFEEVKLVKPVGKIVMTFTGNAVRFNKATAQALGFPAFVRVLVNEKTKQIALAVTTSKANNAVKFSKTEEKQSASVSFKEKAVVEAVAQFFTLGEAPEGEVAYISVPGTYYPGDKAVIFDAEDATAGTMKRRGRKKASETESAE
ncbi:hypothetical protein JS528_07270 [Bifidobacterium sp. MA2]|uniref:Uncharacterized protein n=1 Tax=Bifidobacterium santillanense TaxID=2809028 RepID=A0ABS5UQP3_9BIFI|nr:hypothetical protein [Bifidobacterium santillanense]MBT1173153.1 hypothetical protein [Bifidobacterium santillanense]